MRTHSSLHGFISVVTAASFVAMPFAQLVGSAAAANPAAPSTQAKPATPAAQTKAAGAAAAPAATATPPAAPDGGWPKGFTTPAGGRLTLYQPQVASWDNKEHMVAYSAVAYEVTGAEKPILGTVKFEADTSVAMDKRLVSFEGLKVSEMNFSSANRDQTQDIAAELQSNLAQKPERVIALDRVLANIDKSAIIPKNVEGVKADAPKIFYSSTKAILVGFDGEPIWSPIKDNDLKYVINTNWDVFQDGPSKTLYLRDGKHWYTATAIDGPWSPAGKLPESFKKLPADENWKDVKANYPGDKIDAKKMPKVFVSTTPAEMILIDGAPNYLLVEGTKDLLWVENTESDVFRVQKDGPLYYLVAGRWFSAPDFNGPWTFATPKLPAQFKQIPPEHPRSRVLASVPGTDQANEAVLLAQVPQTARVNKKQIKAPEVQYQGDPKFEAIPQTTVSRATNTDKDIIKFGDIYYMCFQGVWFMSKQATGPWEVATSIPKEIYEIPPSSPAHNVTYVTVVEDKSDDDWATFAVVAGYTGMMVAWGCAVWGTGYYYPPYIGYGGFYPVYYPYYRTYGASAWYNPYTGAYGRRVSAYGPYGGVTAGARYNPRTGTYSRGAMAYGPYGARGAGSAYNPRTGAVGATRQGSNVYGSWGATSVQRGDQWANTARVTNRATGATTRVTNTNNGGAITRNGAGAGNNSFVAGNGDNMYAGRDGNVYKKNDGGGWSKYDNGNWNNVDRPDTNVTRDSAARAEGATRTRDYGTYERSGGGSAGSYRGGGGGYSRGGGARGGGRRR
jgi:hypothetical protein